MHKIKIMVNGLPGNMAANVVKHALADPRFELIPHSLTGPQISATACEVENFSLSLIHPHKREAAIMALKEGAGVPICVDYTHPSAVNSNAEFYCAHRLPFVMGTTGGDRRRLEETVRGSSVSAVIAPNMAKQIVAFQAMMEYAAEEFGGLFAGYDLEIKESHQNGKADTSGTAKAMVRYFNALGLPFAEGQIKKERDPQIQKSVWGVPEQFLTGHAYHTYSLVSPDGTVKFQFTHNVNGRDVYALGTLDAVRYLSQKVTQGVRGAVYSTIDVLKGK